MSMQLVLSVDTSDDGKSLADNFRWCWLGADGAPAAGASGDREALRAALGERPANPQSAWLILPGSRVNTRELEYSDKEKKHLRNLLPFQLEDSVVGDVEELHFALGTPANGKVVVAFADKIWMQAAFAELAALGVEVTRCWTAPLTLPLATEAVAEASNNHWTLGLYQGQVYLRYANTLGFSIAQSHARVALQMLLREQERVDSLPSLHLRAASEADLALLGESIPAELQPSIASHTLADEWALDFSNSSIDLCQGDFSQRLPIERWWKLWQSVAIFAGVCVAVYLGTLLFEINKLGRENLKIRQQIEAVARSAIPQGRIVDPEKQLNTLLRQSQPVDQSVSVMSLLAIALPQITQVPSVQVKGISFAGESGELNFSIQADSFSAFESLSQNLRNQGLNAETSSFNAQGNVQTARLRVTKNP